MTLILYRPKQTKEPALCSWPKIRNKGKNYFFFQYQLPSTPICDRLLELFDTEKKTDKKKYGAHILAGNKSLASKRGYTKFMEGPQWNRTLKTKEEKITFENRTSDLRTGCFHSEFNTAVSRLNVERFLFNSRPSGGQGDKRWYHVTLEADVTTSLLINYYC